MTTAKELRQAAEEIRQWRVPGGYDAQQRIAKLLLDTADRLPKHGGGQVAEPVGARIDTATSTEALALLQDAYDDYLARRAQAENKQMEATVAVEAYRKLEKVRARYKELRAATPDDPLLEELSERVLAFGQELIHGLQIGE